MAELNSAGNVRVSWYPTNGFANPGWATVAELNNGLPIEDLLDLGDYSPFVSASDTETTNPMGTPSAVEVLSSDQYGGSLTTAYPGYKADMQNLAAVFYAISKFIRVEGFLVWSIDGKVGDAGQAVKGDFQDGDRYSVIKTWMGGWTDQITGDERFTYERTLNRDGGIWLNRVATTSGTPTLALTGAGLSGTAGSFGTIKAEVGGREFTRGVRYSSSDSSVATVSRNGVVTLVSAGTADITATVPGTAPAVTETETVTVT